MVCLAHCRQELQQALRNYKTFSSRPRPRPTVQDQDQDFHFCPRGASRPYQDHGLEDYMTGYYQRIDNRCCYAAVTPTDSTSYRLALDCNSTALDH